MNHKGKIGAVLGGVALFAGLLSARAVGAFAPPPPPSISPPASIDDTCSTNVTAALNAWFATVPNNSYIVFPSNGCYLINALGSGQPTPVNGGAYIQNWQNVTLNGQGTTLRQTTYPTGTNWVEPILRVDQTTNVEIESLKMVGPNTGGGESNEGDYGIVLTSTVGTLVFNNQISNVDGDFYQVWAANVTSPCGQNNQGPLNQGVTFTANTMTNTTSGYHGGTVQAALGFTFNDNTETGGNDIVDFEFDGTQGWCNGQPTGGGEGNILYQGNTFMNVGGPAWLNGQGCGNPPVPICNNIFVNNWRFIANRFVSSTPTVLGPSCQCQSGVRDQAGDPSSGLVITGNTSVGPMHISNGAPPNGTGAFEVLDWQNVNIQSNKIYFWNGTPTFLGHAFAPITTLNNVTNGIVKNNFGSGAAYVISDLADGTIWDYNHGTPIPNTGVTNCGNVYGYNNPDANGIATTVPSQTDGAC